jgi:hypothetical protein
MNSCGISCGPGNRIGCVPRRGSLLTVSENINMGVGSRFMKRNGSEEMRGDVQKYERRGRKELKGLQDSL